MLWSVLTIHLRYMQKRQSKHGRRDANRPKALLRRILKAVIYSVNSLNLTNPLKIPGWILAVYLSEFLFLLNQSATIYDSDSRVHRCIRCEWQKDVATTAVHNHT